MRQNCEVGLRFQVRGHQYRSYRNRSTRIRGGGGIAMWGGLKILGQKKICSSFLALTASRERFHIDKRNKLFGYLYNIADLSRASDDDLQTKCEALESALTANYCDGILKDNNG